MSEEHGLHEFSVWQFFEDGSYERVREWVSAESAFEAFDHYTNNVASKMGITKRVIITDGGDCINMEWKLGEGIVFPTKEMLNEQAAPTEAPTNTNPAADHQPTASSGEPDGA